MDKEKDWIDLTWQEKEEKALALVKKYIKTHDKPVVACSWGKDSLTVLHMVYRVCKELNKPFDVLWNNTTVHYPSVYSLKRRLEKEWDLKVIETKPDKKFEEIVTDYGFPGVEGSDRSDRANQSCCYYIKKKPTKKAISNNGWDLYFDGLTAYESDRRYMNISQYGLFHLHKQFKLNKCHPIGWWNVADVWNYIDKHDIPYPGVYDNEVDDYTKLGYTIHMQGHRTDRAIRNGCWCCPLTLTRSSTRMKQLRIFYPKLWQYLMSDMGLAKEIASIKLGGQGDLVMGYFDEKTQQHWLDNRPCFFDKL